MSASPYDLVRVQDPVSGSEYTTSRAAAESSGLAVLDDKEPFDAFGRPASPLPRTNLAGQPVAPQTNTSEKETD